MQGLGLRSKEWNFLVVQRMSHHFSLAFSQYQRLFSMLGNVLSTGSPPGGGVVSYIADLSIPHWRSISWKHVSIPKVTWLLAKLAEDSKNWLASSHTLSYREDGAC